MAVKERFYLKEVFAIIVFKKTDDETVNNISLKRIFFKYVLDKLFGIKNEKKKHGILYSNCLGIK